MNIKLLVKLFVSGFLILSSSVVFSKDVTVRIVSKDLSADNELHQQYMQIGVDALKKQGINIKLEIVELTGCQSYK